MFKIHLQESTVTEKNILEVLKQSSFKNEWEALLLEVLREWFGKGELISFFTSGSTGIPKKIAFKRTEVEASAKLTATTFELPMGSTVLLCLHPKYVAAKMMILRALINGWELTVVEPTKKPKITKKYDFSAMVPMQVNSLIEDDFTPFERINKVIIGGAPISEKLHRKILRSKNHCFATYGMTETLTHVAVQQLNGVAPTAFFVGLNGVDLNQDENDCLNIRAKHLGGKKIQTNDVVRFVDFGKFIWLGRYDHVINSGGVKIHPEQLEKKLEKLIDRRLFVLGEKDELLGQKVSLVIEGEKFDSVTLNLLKSHLKDILSKFERPKKIIFMPKLIETDSGKIIREITKL